MGAGTCAGAHSSPASIKGLFDFMKTGKDRKNKRRNNNFRKLLYLSIKDMIPLVNNLFGIRHKSKHEKRKISRGRIRPITSLYEVALGGRVPSPKGPMSQNATDDGSPPSGRFVNSKTGGTQ